MLHNECIKSMSKFTLLFIVSYLSASTIHINPSTDYKQYHLKVIEAEKLIIEENYQKALPIYEGLFETYHFIFLREYQVATQLALCVNAPEKAEKYLKSGILAGWTLKSIKKNKYLSSLWKTGDWKRLKKTYPKLKAAYEAKLNQKVKDQVKKMYNKDQKKAFMVFLKWTSKSKEKYAENNFAPHSEQQIAALIDMLEKYGYPGEQLIGDNIWMSTILSHHNSMSTAYTQKDTLYPKLLPKLKMALNKGQITPYELATMDDWYLSVKSNRKTASYGILDRPTPVNLSKTNELRNAIYARPFEWRDQLVALQKKTGMNFYLSDRWY